MINILKVEKEDFTDIREKRGIWAVKKYLHWYCKYKGKKVLVKFRRKHNRTYEEVCHHQYIVDEFKTFFELNKMNTQIVFSEIEGYGIMLDWHETIGTVKMREIMGEWLNPTNLNELFKMCIFDGVIGGLDRHGNNVIVKTDKTLLTIDDEDVFYDKLRVWIKFDKDIKRMIYFNYLKNKEYFDEYIKRLSANKEKILEVANLPIMKTNPTYPYFDILKRNLDGLNAIYTDTIRQLLL